MLNDKFYSDLENKAKELGFDVIGFTPATVPDYKQDRLREFVDCEQHGEMLWMANTLERRISPDKMWADVKSAIVLGMNYAPNFDPLENLGKPNIGNISVYARNRDYHDVLKGKLKNLAQWIMSRTREFSPEVKVFVDTAPLMEKALASQTSIGWQSKNTTVLSKTFGNWLFFGEILTTLELKSDESVGDHCGGCVKCVVACPTGAIYEDYKLDASKCISYLTIEHKGHIADEFLESMGNRIYGCDDCISVCPWNKFAPETSETKYIARPEFNAPNLSELLKLNDETFRAFFSGTPVKRIGYKQFLRNVLIAVGNSGDTQYLPQIEMFLNDDSEVVAKMAQRAKDTLSV